VGRTVSEERQNGQFPAIHIDRRHQSAPSETEADKAVRLAGNEIAEGKWKLSPEAQTELNEVPGLALRDGPTPEAVPWSQQDFDRTDQSLVLGEHPRVQEALARLEQQKEERKENGQAYAELAAMMHDTATEQRRRQRWDGQSRWTDDDAIEACKGQILTPIQFYQRLMEEGIGFGGNIGVEHEFPSRQMEWKGQELTTEMSTIRALGTGRILIGAHAKKRHPQDRSWRVALLVAAHSDQPAALTGQKEEREPVQVATLQGPFSTEWMVMRFDEFGVPTTPRFL